MNERKGTPHVWRRLGELKNGPFREDYYRLKATVLSTVGEDFWSWWVYRKLAGPNGWFKDQRGLLAPEVRLVDLFPGDLGSALRESTESLAEACEAPMRRYGFRFAPERDAFVFEGGEALPKLNPPEGDYPDPTQAVGSLNEALLAIPDLRDPRIFSPHMGRGQSSWYNDGVAEREGLSDARCVLRYLRAYNALFSCASPANLFAATIMPSTSTGPYCSTMSYLADQKTTPDFFALLEIGFLVQRMIFGSGFAPSDFGEKASVDMLMFGRVLESYIRDHSSS